MKALVTILHEVILNTGVTQAEMEGSSRKGHIVFLRKLYAKRARAEGYSLSAIGEFINRGHDTILYYLREIALDEEAVNAQHRRDVLRAGAIG